jgi:hypothetical protein
LPPGITQNDIESTDEFLASAKVDEATLGGAETSPIDMEKAMQAKVDTDKLKGKAKTQAIAQTKEQPYIHKSNIVDENGNPIDEAELIAKIRVRPEEIINQNSKLQKSGKGGKSYVFFNITLPAYKGLYYDESDKQFKVVTTCPSAGACKVFCYARKGGFIQFPGSSMKAARVVNYLMNDWQGFKSQLLSELRGIENKYKGTQVVIRWHDSGDFFSEKYLDIAFDIARETPNLIHYAYTKQVKMVAAKTNRPKNFVFNYSVGGIDDASINTKSDKHSKVVPSKLFSDISNKTDKTIEFTPENLDVFRDRISKEYNVPKNSVITYDELMNIEYDPNVDIKPIWNVLVWKGHGDDAAMRKDVLGTYLLIH